MADPSEIIRDVTKDIRFVDSFDAAALRFHEDLAYLHVAYNEQVGFMQVQEVELAAGAIRLVGFGAPKATDGTFDTSETIRPITHLGDLCPVDQNIDTQGKGVGPRMYNSPRAAFGFTNLPKGGQIGAFTFDLSLDRLLDLREQQGSALIQISRHAVRIVMSRGASQLVSTVDAIHAGYDLKMQERNPLATSPDAVLLKQPPMAAWRQHRKRHAEDPLGMPPEFMIIRNPAVLLRRVGSYLVNATKD